MRNDYHSKLVIYENTGTTAQQGTLPSPEFHARSSTNTVKRDLCAANDPPGRGRAMASCRPRAWGLAGHIWNDLLKKQPWACSVVKQSLQELPFNLKEPAQFHEGGNSNSLNSSLMIAVFKDQALNMTRTQNNIQASLFLCFYLWFS